MQIVQNSREPPRAAAAAAGMFRTIPSHYRLLNYCNADFYNFL